jgi:hypothetical protein
LNKLHGGRPGSERRTPGIRDAPAPYETELRDLVGILT